MTLNRSSNNLLIKEEQRSPSNKKKEALERILNLGHVFQSIDPEFPLQYALSLIIVALDEGISISDLSTRTGLSLSTTSRIVGALSTKRQRGEAYNLIKVRICAEERRRKELYLTDKGHIAIKKLVEIL